MRQTKQTEQKAVVRSQVLLARTSLPAQVRAEAAQLLARRVLTLPEVAYAETVACYVSVGTEPGTGPLLRALAKAGRRVLLPVMLPDADLDWAMYRSESSLRRADRGLWEPVGPPLGLDAVATADVVVVPALAVDSRGVRLGRGGGSYDRALTRVPSGRLVAALLYDGELLDVLPAEAHDRLVGASITPRQTSRFVSANTCA